MTRERAETLVCRSTQDGMRTEGQQPHHGAATSVWHTALWFACVLLVALAVRVYLASVMPIISRDGVTFIRYAQGLQTQPWTEMRRQRQHPLYPASIAVVEAALRRANVAPTDNVRRWLVAGQSVAFAASLAVIPALYWLGCLVFGRRVGMVTAACAVVLPAISHYGVDVLSDTLHLTLYVLALAVGMSGLRRRAWGRIALAGGLAALAFLTRPEGGEVLVVLCGAIVLLRAWPTSSRLAALVVCVGAFGVVAGPYMVITGRLVQKKPIEQFVAPAYAAAGASVAASPALLAAVDTPSYTVALGRGVRAVGTVVSMWVRSLRVMYLLPVIAWLIWRRSNVACPRHARIVLAAAALHFCVCILLIARFEYAELFSMRHVLILAALTLPWSSAGLVALVDGVGPHRRWAGPALALLVVGPTLPWLLRTPNWETAYLRDAGEWIAQTYPVPQRILADRWRVAFYARGELCERYEGNQCVRWPGTADAADLLHWVDDERPDLVVLDQHRLLRQDPAFFETLDRLAIQSGRLRLVYTTPDTPWSRGKRAHVYAVEQ